MTQVQNLRAHTKAYARDYSWKSWWCILSTALFLVTADAGTLPHFPMLLRIICSGLSGLLIVRLFVIYHDQQHRAILPKSRLLQFSCVSLASFLFVPARFGAVRMIILTATIQIANRQYRVFSHHDL